MNDIWNDYVIATYRLAAPGDLAKKAETIALGMTVGSWTDLPAARQEALDRHAGRVVAVEGNLIRIAYPLANLTPDLPALLTATFGKLSMDGKIRLVDLTLPPHFAAVFAGPKLGVEGVRQRTGVHGRPLLMSIFKACLGLTLAELAEGFFQQALGGVVHGAPQRFGRFFVQAFTRLKAPAIAKSRAALVHHQRRGLR